MLKPCSLEYSLAKDSSWSLLVNPARVGLNGLGLFFISTLSFFLFLLEWIRITFKICSIFFIFFPSSHKFIASSLGKKKRKDKMANKKEEKFVYIWGKLLNFTYSFEFSDIKGKRNLQKLFFILSEYFLVDMLRKRITLYNLSLYK